MRTKQYNLTAKQIEVIAKLQALRYKAAWWGRTNEAERIYLRYRRDVRCYVEFDEPQTLEGAALRVFIKDCGQHANWYRSEKQKIKEWASNALLTISGQAEAEAMPNVISEAEAEALEPGQHVEWLTGGEPGAANPERTIDGTVVAVRRKSAPAGTIGNDEQVVVELAADDGGNNFQLYTWRGSLRYGGGAQVVRKPLN